MFSLLNSHYAFLKYHENHKVKRAMELKVEGTRRGGQPKQRCNDCVEDNLRARNIYIYISIYVYTSKSSLFLLKHFLTLSAEKFAVQDLRMSIHNWVSRPVVLEDIKYAHEYKTSESPVRENE